MLYVHYDKPMGYIIESYTDRNETKELEIKLYASNAMLAMIWEHEEEDGVWVRDLYGFFCDKTHMNNCLGLAKGTSNIYNYPQHTWKKIALNKDVCKDYAAIVTAVAKAFDNIEIEVYREAVKS